MTIEQLNKSDLQETNAKICRQSKLYAALAKAQGEMHNINQSGSNPAFRSKYATIGDILEAVRPALTKNQLGITQSLSTKNGETCLKTILFHAEGGTIEDEVVISLDSKVQYRSKIQAIGSLITYWKRYCLSSILGVAAGMCDDDGEGTVGEFKDSTVNFAVKDSKISKAQLKVLSDKLKDYPEITETMLKNLKIQKLADFPANIYEKSLTRIDKLIEEFKKTQEQKYA